MITRLLLRLLAGHLSAEYLRGWGHGVDQHRIDPQSCEHHVTMDEHYQGDSN